MSLELDKFQVFIFDKKKYNSCQLKYVVWKVIFCFCVLPKCQEWPAQLLQLEILSIRSGF